MPVCGKVILTALYGIGDVSGYIALQNVCEPLVPQSIQRILRAKDKVVGCGSGQGWGSCEVLEEMARKGTTEQHRMVI